MREQIFLTPRVSFKHFALFAVFSCLVSINGATYASVRKVCSIVTGTCPYTNIQQAIDDSKDGDIINIGTGIFAGPITLGGVKHLELIGKGPSQTIIQQFTQLPNIDIQGIVTCSNNVTVEISGLTITGNTGSLVGTGIRNNNCNMAISNSIIQSAGRAINDGGGIANGGFMQLTDSIVRDCESSNGGGISNIKTLIIKNSLIENNIGLYMGGTLPGGGGILNERGARLTVIDSQVNNNISNTGGSGIVNLGTLMLRNSNIHHNTQTERIFSETYGSGGGIYNAGTLVMDKNFIDHNESNIAGGGLFEATGSVVKTVGGPSFFLDNAPDDCVNDTGVIPCPLPISNVTLPFTE